MEKKVIRALFFLLIPVLFLQFLYSLKFPEPYPAIKFPGFGKIPAITQEMEYTKYELLAYTSEQDYETIEVADLLENYPKTYHPYIIKTIFKNQEAASGNKKSSGIKSGEKYAAFQGWLENRLFQKYGKRYSKMVINQYKNKHTVNSPELQENTELLKKVEIPFNS